MLQCISCIFLRSFSKSLRLARTSFWMHLSQSTPPDSPSSTSHSPALESPSLAQFPRSSLRLRIRTPFSSTSLQSVSPSQSCKIYPLNLLPSQCNPHSCTPPTSGYRKVVLFHTDRFRKGSKFWIGFLWTFAFYGWQPPQQCSWRWVDLVRRGCRLWCTWWRRLWVRCTS